MCGRRCACESELPSRALEHDNVFSRRRAHLLIETIEKTQSKHSVQSFFCLVARVENKPIARAENAPRARFYLLVLIRPIKPLTSQPKTPQKGFLWNEQSRVTRRSRLVQNRSIPDNSEVATMRNLGDDDNGMLGRVAFLLVVVVSFSAFVSARQKNGLSILTPQKNEKLHPLFVLSSGSGRRVATADTLGVRAAHRPAVHAKRRDRSGVDSKTKCSALGTAQSRSIPFLKFATREGSRTNDPAWPRSSPRGFSVLRSHVGLRHDARSDHAGLAFQHHARVT